MDVWSLEGNVPARARALFRALCALNASEEGRLSRQIDVEVSEATVAQPEPMVPGALGVAAIMAGERCMPTGRAGVEA